MNNSKQLLKFGHFVTFYISNGHIVRVSSSGKIIKSEYQHHTQIIDFCIIQGNIKFFLDDLGNLYICHIIKHKKFVIKS